jgi:hypothetical protein
LALVRRSDPRTSVRDSKGWLVVTIRPLSCQPARNSRGLVGKECLGRDCCTIRWQFRFGGPSSVRTKSLVVALTWSSLWVVALATMWEIRGNSVGNDVDP